MQEHAKLQARVPCLLPVSRLLFGLLFPSSTLLNTMAASSFPHSSSVIVFSTTQLEHPPDVSLGFRIYKSGPPKLQVWAPDVSLGFRIYKSGPPDLQVWAPDLQVWARDLQVWPCTYTVGAPDLL